MKLSEDQKDLLRNLVTEGAWDAVIAAAQAGLSRLEDNVLKCDISKPRELIIKRANLDGAKTLVQTLQNLKKDLRG